MIGQNIKYHEKRSESDFDILQSFSLNISKRSKADAPRKVFSSIGYWVLAVGCWLGTIIKSSIKMERILINYQNPFNISDFMQSGLAKILQYIDTMDIYAISLSKVVKECRGLSKNSKPLLYFYQNPPSL